MDTAAVWVPAIVALALGSWRITVPSLWRDESVSGVVARLPLSYMRQLIGDIDAVHALYYLLLRPFAASGGSEFLLRLPSLLAFGAAAYGVAALGRRLAGPLAGLYGGLIYALLPMADRYAQEARSYAIVSAVAVLATWLLVAALSDASRRRYAAYAVSVFLLGSFHLYALLLLPAHALAVRLARPRRVLPWVISVAAACAALLPLVAVASGEREAQLFWVSPPDWRDVGAFFGEVAGNAAAAVVVLALAAYGAWRSRRTPVLALWVVLPLLGFFVISQVHPIYSPRYALFVVPALALLAGIGLERAASALRGGLAYAAPAVAVVLVGALTASTQVAIREPDSRPDDLRSLAAVLAAEERPGDGALYVPQRFHLFVSVYEAPYEHLVDLTNAPGVYEPRTPAEMTAAAAGLQRVWLISPDLTPRYANDPRLQALRRDFTSGPAKRFGSIRLALLTRK
ncbi:glycosyltransferase family 39 protein [Planotetraspora thailandica]|uniref:glycosyltransferase family 39 protein n=1 Tax=Planotetraspora thailandica TaxID=487172 RepID=UPI00194E2D63|nr:glycosyltransferase family 39 protein [Planotetraspora thailandica]